MSTPEDRSRRDRKDFWWKLYCEKRTHLRYLQSERATASNIILVTSIALIGLIANGPLLCEDWPLTGGLILIGVYGTLFMMSHFGRIDQCKKSAENCLNELRQLIGIELSSSSSDTKPTEETKPNPKEPRKHRKKPSAFRCLKFIEKCQVVWPLAIAIIGLLATAVTIGCLCWHTTRLCNIRPLQQVINSPSPQVTSK